MFDINTLIMFTAASALLAFAPGPDNIFVLTQSMMNGRAAGFRITMGLCTGLLVHTTVVALGVAAIFRSSLIAFNVLKYAGAAYLLFLAWKSFRSASERIELSGRAELTSMQLYRRGIIMNVTNPKVSMFFLAFLPQFASPGKGSIPVQIAVLGFIFIIVTILVFGLISQLSGLIGEWVSKTGKGGMILDRAGGTVMMLLALKLLVTRQN